MLAILLPDIALAGLFLALRASGASGAVAQLALAMTAGALVGCLWSDIRIFLLERLEENKRGSILTGSLGAGVAGLLYLVFGAGFFELHERFLVGKPGTPFEITLIHAGVIGGIIGLGVRAGLRTLR